MSWVDWALLAVLLVSALVGLWRGLVYEVLSVAGWVLAFVLAQAWAEPVGMLLPMDGAAPPLRLAAGFAAVFIAVAFAAGLLSWLIKKMVESVGLRPVDRVLGGGVWRVARVGDPARRHAGDEHAAAQRASGLASFTGGANAERFAAYLEAPVARRGVASSALNPGFSL
ncbi:CvpA family protein [Hydrogenophaga sp.]|uniref:CvpA family protein n=1 Tax=Hydrogenophaga sp. TaxID=1904254 RepID=UPI0034276E90